MKIPVTVRIEEDFDAHVSSDDIRLIFEEDHDSMRPILRELSDIATFLNGVPDSKIKAMDERHRRTVFEVLNKQAERFRKGE